MTPVTHADPRRVRLVSDGVVAAYIHDISARTAPAATSRRDGSPQARLAHTRAALRGRAAASSHAPAARRSVHALEDGRVRRLVEQVDA